MASSVVAEQDESPLATFATMPYLDWEQRAELDWLYQEGRLAEFWASVTRFKAWHREDQQPHRGE